jgi:cytochrome c553
MLLNSSIAICATVYSLDAVAQSSAAPVVAAVCAPCHGLDGIGHDVEVPNLAGQHSSYLRKQLLAFKVGDESTRRCTLSGGMTDREIDDLVDYYPMLSSR